MNEIGIVTEEDGVDLGPLMSIFSSLEKENNGDFDSAATARLVK